eukprot:UN03461
MRYSNRNSINHPLLRNTVCGSLAGLIPVTLMLPLDSIGSLKCQKEFRINQPKIFSHHTQPNR